jgi:transposase
LREGYLYQKLERCVSEPSALGSEANRWGWPWAPRARRKEPDILGATRILRLSWDEAWHILERAVARGRRTKGPRVPRRLGVDEKAAAKGQQSLTLVCDLDQAAVEYIADERKQASLDGYFQGLSAEQRAGIEAVAMDMWPPYIQSVRAYVPDAEATIVFDRYRIMGHMGEAVNDVRKREHRERRAVGDETLSGSKTASTSRPRSMSIAAASRSTP